MSRKTISKKVRFEVFKRDGFTCQYCGAMAPDVLLEVDHIQPVSKGGANDILNYVTSCQACNSGKSDRTLDDSSAVKKQQAQLTALQERRAQLEMMLAWREGLKDIQAEQEAVAAAAWTKAAEGWHLNDVGLKQLRQLLKKRGLPAVLDAIETAADRHLTERDEDGNLTGQAVNNAWNKVGGICAMNALPEDERRLYYIKGILNKRLNYVPYDVVDRLKDVLGCGCPVEEIEQEAKRCRSWSSFRDWLLGI